MGLYLGGLIVGRIFAFEIWGGGLFSVGLILWEGGGGWGANYRNFTVFDNSLCPPQKLSSTIIGSYHALETGKTIMFQLTIIDYHSQIYWSVFQLVKLRLLQGHAKN